MQNSLYSTFGTTKLNKGLPPSNKPPMSTAHKKDNKSVTMTGGLQPPMSKTDRLPPRGRQMNTQNQAAETEYNNHPYKSPGFGSSSINRGSSNTRNASQDRQPRQHSQAPNATGQYS